MSQFVDLVRIKVQSGDGGNGMVAWRREKYEPMGGPAGGNGGAGGSVFIEATRDLNTLLDFRFKKEFEAKPGQKGGSKNMHGKSSPALTIKVPVGTLVRDLISGQIIADLKEAGQKVLVAEGGRGGRGNTDLVTRNNRAPYHCEPGEEGISRELELELKVLADVGIVGLPNAGKSTLLSVLTAARPKIAAYPFSTLEPNLGVVQIASGDGFVMADVPGLVEGAAQGIGLGHQFLRHLERTRLLVHMVDLADADYEKNITTIGNELGLYGDRLSRLPQIVVLNKIDVLSTDEVEAMADDVFKKLPELLPGAQKAIAVIPVSCATRSGIDQLRDTLVEELSLIPKDQAIHEVSEDLGARQHPDEGFNVVRSKNKFFVTGNRIERMVAVTNMRSPEALVHLFNIMKAMGIIEALIKNDIQVGQEIIIGDTTFTFGDEMR